MRRMPEKEEMDVSCVQISLLTSWGHFIAKKIIPQYEVDDKKKSIFVCV